ncbi:YfhO family protein [Fictibacillus nanhaiensis]|uniref:YfhO family protein n=1 Tax=Fictibacillus nanhaiensis TaxID=742169 RepID=A0ABS2ZP52_9BACL|nr:YfhO family protein [Fictibacillus nanhaiensis]
MNNFVKNNKTHFILLIFVLSISVFILYKIPLNHFYYFSALGDTKEQYVHFFNHYYDLIHRGELPFWSWEYGMGGSFWNDFGYYMLGDIFVWPFFLFPKAWFPALFIPMSILKLLLMSSGVYLLLKKTGVKEHWAFLGALIYPFAGYHFDYLYTHYFFINAAVYFPFLLLGYERYLQHKKPGLLILVIFLASIGNFYLMFLLTIGLLLYAITRFFYQDPISRSLKSFVIFHSKLSLVYLAGLALSMPIFLPSVLSYLQSNAQVRSGPKFEAILTFSETINRISITGGMHYMIFAIIPLLIIRFKRTYSLIILCSVLWCIMQFPVLTSFIGGFSRPEELRGFFIINLLTIYIAIHGLNQMKRGLTDMIALFIGITLVVIWLFKHPYSRYDEWLVYLPLIWFIGLLLFFYLQSKTIKSVVFMITSLLCVGYSAAIGYSFVSDLIVKAQNPNSTNVTHHKGIWSILPLLNRDIYENSYDNKTLKVTFDQLKENNEFHRVVANIPGGTAINSSLTYDYKGFYSYHSLIPWKQQKFEMDTLAQPGQRGFNLLRGFGNSTYLTTLFSNKYFISTGSEPKLFGYTLDQEERDLKIYKNEYFLPMGFVYDQSMSTAQFLSLPVYEREQAMMQYAIIDAAPMKRNLTISDNVISDNQDITVNGERITNPNTKIKSEKAIEIKVPTPIKGKGQLSVYANIDPLNPNEGMTMIAKKDDSSEINYVKNMRNGSYVLSQYSYENTVNEVLFKFGEISEENKTITLTLLPGEYVIKDIKAIFDPMIDYKAHVQTLKQNTMKNIKTDSLSFTGTLKSKKSGILFLSIPYNKGWIAKVDGKRTDIIPTHYTYSGIKVNAGTQNIELYFIPQGLLVGVVISAISIICLIVYSFRRKKVHNQKELTSEVTPIS